MFPRGRPEERIDNVSERVKAMKKEFQEYRQQQLQQQQQQQQEEEEDQPHNQIIMSNTSSKSSTMSKTDSNKGANSPNKLESLI